MTDATSYPCVQCGSPVPRSAQFCLVCGTPAAVRSQSVALGQVAGQVPLVDSSGRPMDGWRPEPAAPPIRYGDIIPSGFGRRVVAFLLDGLVTSVLWLVIVLPLLAVGVIEVVTDGTVVSVSGLSAVLLFLPLMLYPLAKLFLESFLGFSLGKLVMGLRIVNVTRLGRPGLGWVLLRNLVVAAGALVFGVGQYVVLLSPLWDGEKRMRGWQDKVGRTWVIDIKAGPNPLKALPGQLLLDQGTYEQQDPALYGAPAAPPAPSAPAAPAAPAMAPVDYAPPAAPPAPSAPIASVPGFAPAAPVITPAEAAADDFESTRLSDSARPPLATGVTVFRLDTGEIVPIIRHGALGRDPVAPGGDPSDVLIALSGDTLSVSKTHLEFGVDSGAVWVSDRGSTNGSAIVRADGVEYPLDPGERLTVVPGDRVRVGTRLFSVESGA
ncbi:RDD family protein [Herbiconiux sp. CPCC 203407]|uniref:RDD family protein n=1 Tax=Herbiconiux oxytropis TaxID=2970915 RepID=A0AA41XHC6_9MICO|nr:RDD family protein [Herbiconiux oxytropis]MCS5720712.1 RDD family protein [Herbiconiux oxytropis]MCS5724961.1 RDD family protein [Herbiconiux oxytropis]